MTNVTFSKQISLPNLNNGLTYDLDTYAAFAYTIAEVYQIQTSSGTVTAAVKINGSAVSGLSNIAVTSTPQNVAAGANSVSIGDKVQLVFSSNSAATNIVATLSATRDSVPSYAEGSWTPTDGSGASLTFTNTSGNCITRQIGKMMFATFMITWPTTASGAGVQVNGLPVVSATTSNDVSPVVIAFTDEGNPINGRVGGDTTWFTLYNTSGTALTNANMSGKTIRGMAIYAL